MAIPEGFAGITAVVPESVRCRVADLAASAGMSVSRYLSALVCEHVQERPETRAVRSNGRELFVSLPRSWVSDTGTAKGDRVPVSYGPRHVTVGPV